MLCLKLLICSGDISIINGILSIPSGNSGFVSAKTSLVRECNFTDKCTAKPSLLSRNIFGGYGSICKHEFEPRKNSSNAHFPYTNNTFETMLPWWKDGQQSDWVRNWFSKLPYFLWETWTVKVATITFSLCPSVDSPPDLSWPLVPNLRRFDNTRVVIPAPTFLCCLSQMISCYLRLFWPDCWRI